MGFELIVIIKTGFAPEIFQLFLKLSKPVRSLLNFNVPFISILFCEALVVFMRISLASVKRGLF